MKEETLLRRNPIKSMGHWVCAFQGINEWMNDSRDKSKGGEFSCPQKL